VKPWTRCSAVTHALLGIAGRDAFLRAPNGQTGLLREGGELGGIKVLRIGTNRVLIEHQGQKKELTVFSGLGSETLCPKKKRKPHETTGKSCRELWSDRPCARTRLFCGAASWKTTINTQHSKERDGF